MSSMAEGDTSGVETSAEALPPVERVVMRLGIPGDLPGMPATPREGNHWHFVPLPPSLNRPAISGPPEWFLKAEEERKKHVLPVDFIGAGGVRTMYHTSMGRMMGVRGG